MAANRFYS